MRYSKLLWNHPFPDEPTEIYSEHDEAGWERRKVELFRDGGIGFAGATEGTEGTKLSLIQCPPDDEVNSEPEFKVVTITRDEFEQLWRKAHQLVESA